MDLEALKDTLTIDLSTVGRRSGEWSRIEIWWFFIDDRFVITGTPGPRDWYANVLAEPSVIVHANGSAMQGTAIPIVDAEERRRILTHAKTSWYSTQSELDALVDGSPMIQIRLDC